MKKTWYHREGSKKAELWTILHLPYTFMAISFLITGFAIKKPINYEVMVAVVAAYFLGLGVAAHCLDQLPGMGSHYIRYLTEKELLFLASVSLVAAIVIGIHYMLKLHAWHLLWLIPLQTFFAITYPVAKLFRGFFHNDFWFSVSFGAIPVLIGYYMNNLSFSLIILPFALLCALISAIEITLSRHARRLRKDLAEGWVMVDHDLKVGLSRPEETHDLLIGKPEKSLKLLCVMSYTLAVAMVLM